MKISKELSTGTLPMLVLSVLGSEDLYGYRIIKILETRSDNAFSLKEGTLYPILHALEQEGCLDQCVENGIQSPLAHLEHIFAANLQLPNNPITVQILSVQHAHHQ